MLNSTRSLTNIARTRIKTINLKTDLTDKMVTIKIKDNGSGIPDHVRHRIFEPFFTTKEAGEGTGLGLALVYSIIEEHFGNIQVESPYNKATNNGTCFTITLARNEHN